MEKFTDPAYAPKFMADKGSKYLIVVSDGEDMCGIDCVPYGNRATIIDDLKSLTKKLLDDSGIHSFAIGFGNSVNLFQLNAIARSGGTPYSEYFEAEDPGALTNAFQEILDSIVSCVYNLSAPKAAADPDKVNFYFDGDAVLRDDSCKDDTGWRFTTNEHTQVEFCKKTCADLKAGKVKTVSAKFGCPTYME